MAEAYGISGSSLGKIARWFNARKAAGQTVQPWEMEAAYSGEMDAIQKNRTASRGLSLQQKSLDLQAARDAENAKQTAINNSLTREQMDISDKNATKGLIGSAATTGAGLYMMSSRGKDAAETPGVTDAVGETLSKIGTNAKKIGSNLFDRVTGNTTAGAVSSGTTTPLVEGGVEQLSGPGMDIAEMSGTPMVAESSGSGIGLIESSDTPVTAGKTTGQTISDYAVPVVGGFVGENLVDATGLGEKTSEIMPFGGRKDWNRAAGAGVAAGLASLAGVNPLYAAAGYLGAAIGLDGLF